MHSLVVFNNIYEAKRVGCMWSDVKLDAQLLPSTISNQHVALKSAGPMAFQTTAPLSLI